MKKYLFNWQVLMGAGLIALSSVLYYVHYLIFGDARHIFIYLLGDIAFIPIEVLIVTVIIHQLLELRAKSEKMEKMNMVIGVYFSEVGTQFLAMLSKIDRRLADITDHLCFSSTTAIADFDKTSSYLKSHSYEVADTSKELDNIKVFLLQKREFLLRLLENPNLLEHETFTDLLRATFHLTEELANRETLNELSAKDYEHINGDLKRAYSLLVIEWVNYMKHLRSNYPYLFSLAIRMNPFDRNASVEVK
jgi:hypothetical protein